MFVCLHLVRKQPYKVTRELAEKKLYMEDELCTD